MKILCLLMMSAIALVSDTEPQRPDRGGEPNCPEISAKDSTAVRYYVWCKHSDHGKKGRHKIGTADGPWDSNQLKKRHAGRYKGHYSYCWSSSDKPSWW